MLCKKYKTLYDFLNNNTILTKSLYKETYGEVFTPINFIEEILQQLPYECWSNPYLKWLDTGAGSGNFSIVIYYYLMEKLKHIIDNEETRTNHVINMITMVEINENNISNLRNIFGNEANIIHADYLSYDKLHFFDIIIGNPPYHSISVKKVPTNNNKDKINDGNTLWHHFVIKSYSLLNQKGYILYIIPNIWLKPDKAKMYEFITNNCKILSIKNFNNTQTNKIFNNEAQTPTCIVCLQKENFENKKQEFYLYDYVYNNYQKFSLIKPLCIPVNGCTIIMKLFFYIKDKNIPPLSRITHKTNLPSKHVILYNTPEENICQTKFTNIHSCVLDKNNNANLVIKYSNKPCPYYNEKKLVLAHKMYGFPFFDINGYYGISNRDSYVIKLNENNDYYYNQYKLFLTTKLAIFLFSTTTYRMKYLEKYIFEYIPQIHLIADFPSNITNKSVCNFFELNELEENYVNNFIKKKYVGF